MSRIEYAKDTTAFESSTLLLFHAITDNSFINKPVIFFQVLKSIQRTIRIRSTGDIVQPPIEHIHEVTSNYIVMNFAARESLLKNISEIVTITIEKGPCDITGIVVLLVLELLCGIPWKHCAPCSRFCSENVYWLRTIIGEYHLTMVFRTTADGWKIVLVAPKAIGGNPLESLFFIESHFGKVDRDFSLLLLAIPENMFIARSIMLCVNFRTTAYGW